MARRIRWQPILIGLGCIVVALGLALVLGRAWLRTDRGRARVGALAGKALAGAIPLGIEIQSLGLAEADGIVAGPIVIRDPRAAPGDPPLLEVRSIRLAVDWLGLVAGRIRVRSLVIDTPVGDVPRAENGALRWPAFGGGEASPPSGSPPSGKHSWPKWVTIDELALRNGRLTLHAPPGGRAVTVDSLVFRAEGQHDLSAGASRLTFHELSALWREGDLTLQSAAGRLERARETTLTTTPWRLDLASAPITLKLAAQGGRAQVDLEAPAVPAGGLRTLHPALTRTPAFGLRLNAAGPIDLGGPIALTLALETMGARATVEGEIDSLRTAPAARLALTIANFDPQRFHPKLPMGRLGLEGQVAGRLGADRWPDARFDLRLTGGSLAHGRPIAGRVAGRMREGQIAVTPLTFRYAGSELAGEGSRARDGRLTARLTLAAPELSELAALFGLPLGGDLAAEIHAAGPPEALVGGATIRAQTLTIANRTVLMGVTGEVGVTTARGLRGQLTAGADSVLLPAGGHLAELFVNARTEPVAGGREHELEVHLQATRAAWARSGIAPSPLALAAHGRRRAGGVVAATIDTLTWGEAIALAAPLTVDQRPGQLRLTGLDLALAGGTIRGEGSLGGRERAVMLDVEALDLGALATLVGFGRRPPATSDSTLARALAEVAADSAHAHASLADSLLARAIPADTAVTAPPIAGELTASIRIMDAGSGPTGEIVLDAQEVTFTAWPTPPIALALESEVTSRAVIGTLRAQVLEDTIGVRGHIPVHLEPEPGLAWDNPAFELEVAAAGDSLAKYLGPVIARLQRNHLLAERLRSRLATTGVVLVVKAHGPARDPAAELALDLDLAPLEPLGPGTLTVTATHPADTLAVQAQLTIEGMAAPLVADVRSLVDLDLEERRATLPPSAPLAGNVSLQEFDLRLLDGLHSGDFAGHLNLMAELKGTASAPAAEGKVDLKDGSVEMKSLGLELDRLAFAAEFDEKQFILHSASGRTAKGHISAKGALPLSGDSAAGVELEGEVTGLEFRTPEAMSFEGDAKLALHGTMKRPVLKGHLLVREGSIPVPEKRDKEVVKIPADDPWLKGSAVEGRKSPLGAQLPVDLDLTVDIPRNLWLRNREVNVEIGGDLQLTSPEGALRVTGDLETRQGSVRMLNRRFSVLKGTVSFYGEQTLKPMIDLRAETVVQETTVQIHLTGPIEEPKLEFSSEPSYSEGDIVSLLLFGRTAGELTSGEATFVQDQVGTMASSYVSSRLEAEVGQKLGLDVLEIETGSGHERVAVGKYVSSRTLLRAYQEMGTESYGGVAVEHALTKEFDLEASADDRGQSGIDLMWKRGE